MAAAAAFPVAAAGDSTVIVTGRGLSAAAVSGFGNGPLARAPLQASTIGTAELADAGIAQFSGLTRLDASASDAYNAEGYWSNLALRGFTLDNRFNYRRDGLPINAETAIALENKERLELLKGTSGIQAGTSAPGGLLNLVVKRPLRSTDGQRSLTLQWRESGSLLAAVDLSQRLGAEGAVGMRINAAHEELRPQVRDTEGRRSMAALAVDWQLSPDTLLQAELESSRQRQPSVAGYSLLGDTLPPASSLDRRRNLNRQPWRQDVEFDGDTASLRWQQRLGEDWALEVHTMQQRLHSNDRTAFPYGVYDAASYECAQWCDRYAPDGSFSYWEYISDNERRTSDALQLALQGQWRSGAVMHSLQAGVLFTRYRGRFQDQVFDIAGTGHVDGSLVTPPSAGYLDANTDRDERSAEWFVRDAMRLGEDWQFWVGLRHTRLDRSAWRTSPDGDGDGSLRETQFDRQSTTPWFAVARQLAPRTMLYASWGKGLETDVAPNRARYRNAGASLALDSRQFELGIKHGSEEVEAALTLFDILRDQTADIGACNADASCERQLDGTARHRGIEAFWTLSQGAWRWQAGSMLLHARREDSTLPGVNGQRPVNVPEATLRLGSEWRPPSLQGLALQAQLVAEGRRQVLPDDDTLELPGWSRLDLGLRWQQAWGGHRWIWRVGVDNATDRRAWKESPLQFGHVYLYPLAPRTWRASLQVAL